MLEKLMMARSERKLGEAIANHDLKAMAHYLERGARQIDHLLMRPADFGNGKDMIPAGKFNDPWSLAKQIGLGAAGQELLNRYIPSPEALTRAPERKPGF